MAIVLRLLAVTLALLTGACSTRPPLADGAGAPPAGGDETAPAKGASPGSRPGPTLLAAAQPVTGILVSAYSRPEPADLWAELRAGFRLPAIDNARVRVQRNWYARHPKYLQRVSERARRYAWYIHEELQRRNMPAEIALLPIVESAYDPFAYSHGRAAGLWQFIPGTGKRFGLKQDWWYDGRRDLVDSTRAALDYLQYLHKRFHGDWLLALAAYNSGEGTVIKAQRRNRRKGRPTGFWHLRLPKETSAYVPKLIALKQLVANPERWGVHLQPVPAEPYFEIVPTGAQIDLAVAADLAGIELEDLYRLNPGFNRWATSPAGPHRLLIPFDRADDFREALAKLPPEKRIKWVRHKVGKGETLSHIARRYHTTVAALKSANELRGSSIRVGTHLLVPVSSKEQKNYSLSARARLQRKQNYRRGGRRTRHVVSRGDTFWDLSRQYKVSVRKLASWNGMAPGDPLRVGQKLVIWTREPVSANPGARTRALYYEVRKGDSLSRISSRFKVSVADLRRWNHLPRGRYLKPGQKLKLYVDVTRQTGI
ncbi:MAG TPA: LysM peptidoglycan-binding domain-containing protein [Gammaproteobacteria bacterium]|nr:LysM peptidoglycan-binding domain-containing protein [Gammaproteobacteria bacterium]